MLGIAPECLSGEEHLKECVAYFGRRAHTACPLRVAYTFQYNIIKPKIPHDFHSKIMPGSLLFYAKPIKVFRRSLFSKRLERQN